MKDNITHAIQGYNNRNSSIELFRIIATLTVLIAHFYGWFVGGLPDKLDFGTFSWRWGQFLTQSATCVCVNLFIIISGYFGLKFKISSFVRIALVLIGIYLPFSFLDFILHKNFDIHALVVKSLIITRAGYFVQCYIMLIFFSPVLNAFIIHNHRHHVLVWILLFWFIEIWFGCIMDVKNFGFMKGYSIIHFVLVYMMARLISIYKDKLLNVRQWRWWAGYVVCTIILFVMYGRGIKWGYANPINVISSLCLFMPFLYYSFHNKTINWIAKSTFTVYIIQVTNPAFNFLKNIDAKLLCNYPYSTYLLFAFAIIICFFVLCILYDKARLFVMSPIEKWIKQKIGTTLYNKSLFTKQSN